MQIDVDQIIEFLGLIPHPEGGYYQETFRDLPNSSDEPGAFDERALSTAIYFLLTEGQKSHWHRIDCSEVWHWYAGSPLALSISSAQDQLATTKILGNNLVEGQRPQIVIPANHWQSAQSLGPWSLVGCTVAPGFEFDSFELSDPEFEPGGDSSAHKTL